MPQHYRLLGGPGSPYSLKVRAILRYRRIAHVWIVPQGYLGSGGELAAAGKRMIPVLQYPDGSYHADSTPLAYALEARHPDARSIIPADPGHAFLSHLIEDMADELLVQAMFDYRWSSPADQQFCARRQMSGWLSPLPRLEFDASVDKFTKRQTARLATLAAEGTGDTRSILHSFYARTLDALETVPETHLFLFGSRPALADFGLYGQLSQCAIDPSASAIMRARAPRTFQWVQTLDDTSGIEGDWLAPDSFHPALAPLLALAGSVYLPYLLANAQSVTRADSQVRTSIEGLQWVGAASSYARKCLTWLRREFAALGAAERERIRPLLTTNGCWDALLPDPAQDAGVPDMQPL